MFEFQRSLKNILVLVVCVAILLQSLRWCQRIELDPPDGGFRKSWLEEVDWLFVKFRFWSKLFKIYILHCSQ